MLGILQVENWWHRRHNSSRRDRAHVLFTYLIGKWLVSPCPSSDTFVPAELVCDREIGWLARVWALTCSGPGVAWLIGKSVGEPALGLDAFLLGKLMSDPKPV